MNKYIEDFVSYLKVVNNKSLNTVKAYRSDLLEFISWYSENSKEEQENIAFSKIKTSDIIEFVAYLDSKGNSARSKARKISSIKEFFKYMVKIGELEVNVALDVDSPKIPQTVPKTLSKENVKSLIEAASNTLFGCSDKVSARDKAIIMVFINCGLREHELLSLKSSDIDFNSDSILVRGKGNKERLVYMSDATRNELLNYIENYRPKFKYANDTDALFLSTNKPSITAMSIANIFNKLLVLTGLDGQGYTVHSLRKTCATLMFESGEELRTIKEVLGHSNIQTTTIYVGVSESIKKNAGKKDLW